MMDHVVDAMEVFFSSGGSWPLGSFAGQEYFHSLSLIYEMYSEFFPGGTFLVLWDGAPNKSTN